MHTGSRAIFFLSALLALVTQLVSSAFSDAHAKPVDFSDAVATEVGGNSSAITECAAPVQKVTATQPAKTSTFSMSPTEMRIIAYAPLLRVIGTCAADSRRMASLADANERQLLFVKITRG